MAASPAFGPVPIAWSRWDIRVVAWMAAIFATGFVGGAVGAVIAGRGVTRGLVLLAISFAPGSAWLQATRVLRAPMPSLVIGAAGAVELRHPMLIDAILVPAEDVHSIWIGPFEQPPPSRRDKWIGPRVFPQSVFRTGGWGKNQDTPLVVAFTRTLTIEPRPRTPIPLLILYHAWQPLVQRSVANGMIAWIEESDARAALAHGAREAAAMPAEVRAWLS